MSVRVKCSPDDTVGDLKKLIAAQTGNDASRIRLKRWCVAVESLSESLHDQRQERGMQGRYLSLRL